MELKDKPSKIARNDWQDTNKTEDKKVIQLNACRPI